MKQQLRLIKNQPAFDQVANRWVKLLGWTRPGVLLVQDLLNPDKPPREMGRLRLKVWNPDRKLNETDLSDLYLIPNGSKVTIGNLRYTRVYGGWLLKQYDELADEDYAEFVPDQPGSDKQSDRWSVDCSTRTGDPNYLEVPK